MNGEKGKKQKLKLKTTVWSACKLLSWGTKLGNYLDEMTKQTHRNSQVSWFVLCFNPSHLVILLVTRGTIFHVFKWQLVACIHNLAKHF